MLKKKKLEHHKSSQCYVTIDDNGTINFISYTTLVIQAIRTGHDEYKLFCTGTYSPTTIKQIGWFLKEYFGDICYQQMKQCAQSGIGIIATKKHAEYW